MIAQERAGWQARVISQYYALWENDWSSWRNVAVKIGYVLLHQLDLGLTMLALTSGLHEINPLIRDLLAAPPQLVLIKLAIPIFTAWIVPSRFLMPAVVLLSLIIGWNVKELLLFS